MDDDQRSARLEAWIAEQLPHATTVRIEGLSKIPMGHSAETFTCTVSWTEAERAVSADLVCRLRPPFPGLLEPYDLALQFKILRALEATSVRSPRALWLEATGEVLGREFYVMEQLAGTVYERELPQALKDDPARALKMSQSLVEAIASIHNVRPETTDLSFVAAHDQVDRELSHWRSEIERVKKGPLPALERLADELVATRPTSPGIVTLVHGDPKPGNFAFDEHGEVTGIFDWEMATVGNPLTDIGWAEVNWNTPNAPTNLPGALSADEFIALYEELTGIEVTDRAWYRAFQDFKIAVILLVGAMLFDAALVADERFASMGEAVPFYTDAALRELGVAETLDPGPVAPDPERLASLETKG